MPLDPFFAERLRVHRRYLFGQTITRLRTQATSRLDELKGRFRRAAPVAERAEAPTPVRSSKNRSPAAAARAKHRRAALAWDRDELKNVGTPGPDVPLSEHTIPVEGYPDVRVRIYRPADPSDRPLPALLTFFGGAFRIGGIDYPTTDAASRRRAADAGVAIVAVDYALAPEHRFPTPVEQGYAALVWLHEHAGDLGIDPARIGIGGTSAGGGIAASVTIANRERAHLPLRLQVLEVPVLDLTGAHIDLRATWALGIPSFLAIRELRSVARTYLSQPADARDPLASPLRAASHAGLPPAVILTAEYDPLRGHGAAYGATLRRSGVDASVVRYLGVTHDASIFTGVLPAARRWHAEIVSALRTLHENAEPVREIHVSAAVITDRDGRLLLVRKRGTTAFMQPGGKPDPGETPAQTLVRELDEEIGIRPPIEEVRALGTFREDAANEPGHVVVASVFAVDIGDRIPVAAAEIAELRWVSRADAADLDIAPLALRHFLPK